MAEVYKDLANRDKGAAKPLKEKLDEAKRLKSQETVAAEWAEKGHALLALKKLNMADALAWQRDAAKAGAPLSREPLAGLKAQLAERVKTIEDLQHRAQVQREAAVLIAQRIEVLSTKPWRDAQGVWEALRADVTHWQAQADELAQDANWPSVDAKFPPLLDASRGQLLAVWEAFQGALSLAVAAAEDAAAPLPACAALAATTAVVSAVFLPVMMSEETVCAVFSAAMNPILTASILACPAIQSLTCLPTTSVANQDTICAPAARNALLQVKVPFISAATPLSHRPVMVSVNERQIAVLSTTACCCSSPRRRMYWRSISSIYSLICISAAGEVFGSSFAISRRCIRDWYSISKRRRANSSCCAISSRWVIAPFSRAKLAC